MINRRVNSDNTVHTFKISSDRHTFKKDFEANFVDDGELKKIHFANSLYDINGGFKKILMEVDSDLNHLIRQLYIILDIFYVPPSYLIEENDLIKLGRVNYSGNLIQVSAQSKPKWNGHILVSSIYNEKNSGDLPFKVLQVGPGAFMTAVIQTLFGTLDGMKMLGLEGFEIPETKHDEIQIIIN